MIPKNWTDEDKNKLIELYPYETKGIILKNFPNNTWRYLQNVAGLLGVKRRSGKRIGDVRKLFNGTNESFYWLGLILTDGYISNDGELKIELKVDDYDYLSNFAKFINGKITKLKKYGNYNGNGTCRVKIKDSINVLKIKEMFNLTESKTYHPPNISFITDKDKLLSLLGGMIDGDGSITKKGKIHIDAHKNYYDYLNNLGYKLVANNLISEFSVTTYLDMCRFNISTKDSYRIRNVLETMKIPIMKRKWDRIKKPVIPKLISNKEKIFEMRNSGNTLKEICDEIGTNSVGNLSIFIHKHKPINPCNNTFNNI